MRLNLYLYPAFMAAKHLGFYVEISQKNATLATLVLFKKDAVFAATKACNADPGLAYLRDESGKAVRLRWTTS